MNEFETYCYELLYGDISMDKFEQWVYSNENLSNSLTSEDYLNLISINFKDKYSRSEVIKIIDKYIDHRKFETCKLRSLLQDAMESKDKLADVLMELYYLYCDGYYFFEDLGLGYGLSCLVTPSKYRGESWEDLSSNDKEELLNSFYPQLEEDLKRAIMWIDEEKIIITGTKNDMNRWEYIDNRTEAEKKSTVWKPVLENEKKAKTMLKKFWKFWKELLKT